MAAPAFIAVEGPIGVGKTTLTRRLAASLGADVVLEAAAENPFLAEFYENDGQGALATQLHFLLERLQQHATLSRHSAPRVSDYMLDKDRLFAELTLSAGEFRLYERLRAALPPQETTPDLVLLLQAPTPVLLERIDRRGIPHERWIDAGYLDRLVALYVRHFHAYERGPIMVVDTAKFDFTSESEHYRRLLDRVQSPPRGRSYFNPAA